MVNADNEHCILNPQCEIYKVHLVKLTKALTVSTDGALVFLLFTRQVLICLSITDIIRAIELSHNCTCFAVNVKFPVPVTEVFQYR